MKVLWNEGFIGSLLSCFDVSFFTGLRLAAMFAPWVGVALLIGDMVRVGIRIYDEIQDKKPDRPSPSVNAICTKPTDLSGAIPLTVNSDPTTVLVVLTAPPRGPVFLTAQSSLSECVVDPPTLQFTPANWSVPQRVNVQIQAEDDSTIPDGIRTSITWNGAGITGAAYISFVVRVSTIVCDPAVVTLKRNKDTGDYEGEFEVLITAEVASDAPVTVTFHFDYPEDPGLLTFTPSSLVFTSTDNALPDSSPGLMAVVTRNRQKVAIKRKQEEEGDPAGPDDMEIEVEAETELNKRPCNGGRYALRALKPKLTERILLTMVQARSGNCFVVQNTSLDNNEEEETQYAVIDGGFTETYENLKVFLPEKGKTIDYLFCTHYDQDHIAGLIKLMEDREADVTNIVFNPPSPAMMARFNVLSANTPSPFIILSVKQAKQLQDLAGDKLIPATGFGPPPTTEVAGILLPTLRIKFAGPSKDRYNDVKQSPYKPEFINRASLLFLLESKLPDGFTMLNMGDGYNTFPGKLDVCGAIPMKKRHVHFLQVPHHGSKENSDTSLYSAFPADHYLISCKSPRHGHPSPEVIASIVEANNYMNRTGYTIWITSSLPENYIAPKSNYTINILKEDFSGLTFKFENGEVTLPDPDSYSQLFPDAFIRF
jgi:hypothetical protein